MGGWCHVFPSISFCISIERDDWAELEAELRRIDEPKSIGHGASANLTALSRNSFLSPSSLSTTAPEYRTHLAQPERRDCRVHIAWPGLNRVVGRFRERNVGRIAEQQAGTYTRGPLASGGCPGILNGHRVVVFLNVF